jgi:hypothetical protein
LPQPKAFSALVSRAIRETPFNDFISIKRLAAHFAAAFAGTQPSIIEM